MAERLLTDAEFPEERIREKIQVFDWLVKQGQRKEPRFLVESIRKNYSLPDGFAAQAKSDATQNAALREQHNQKRLKAKQETALSEKENAETRRINDYLASLNEAERKTLEQEALQDASLLHLVDTEVGKAKVHQFLIQQQVQKILAGQSAADNNTDS